MAARKEPAGIECVLATVAFAGGPLERLRRAFAPAELLHRRRDDRAGIAAALERAAVAVLAGDLDERHLRAPRLRWVHCDHAGLDRSARPEVFERGLLVTSSAGRSSPVLAEHAVLFMLALAYRLPAFLDAQREHRWGAPGQDALRGLVGRTVGVVGLGHTGTELAPRCKAFGMRVLGYRRRATPPPPGVDQLWSAERGEGLDGLLRESDFVVLAVPLSDATHHLIGEPELRLMRPAAFLVNMARGAVVDEAALHRALREGWIAGAGLDTFAREPPPPRYGHGPPATGGPFFPPAVTIPVANSAPERPQSTLQTQGPGAASGPKAAHTASPTVSNTAPP
jgi:phosphoglycerate dehydrogenase-like enzyme